MDEQREEFENLARDLGLPLRRVREGDGPYVDSRTDLALCIFARRQPEIDALKAELRMLRDGIQTMGDALADGVWAHLISSDDDLNALDAGVSALVGRLSTLNEEVKRLRKDAESYREWKANLPSYKEHY